MATRFSFQRSATRTVDLNTGKTSTTISGPPPSTTGAGSAAAVAVAAREAAQAAVRAAEQAVEAAQAATATPSPAAGNRLIYDGTGLYVGPPELETAQW